MPQGNEVADTIRVDSVGVLGCPVSFPATPSTWGGGPGAGGREAVTGGPPDGFPGPSAAGLAPQGGPRV